MTARSVLGCCIVDEILDHRADPSQMVAPLFMKGKLVKSLVATFLIPDVETPHVQAKGLPISGQKEPQHYQLIRWDEEIARFARS